ncbi:MAG: hypothetical protein EON90_02510 [Brevundimonas sp.]|nr:MAG: hypothetical protein EON90_02510 [Brevundimonas sp.]
MTRLFLLFGVLISFAAGPAHADWRKAESEHFVVYGDTAERDLRAYAVALERFDHLLRLQLGVPAAPEGEMKLAVYLVQNRRELDLVQADLPTNIGGFYSAHFRDVRAVAIPGDGDVRLRHEYAHHFMFRNFPGSYPAWFREGFADFFGTATTNDQGRAEIGKPERGRVMALNNLRWLPMDRVLSPWSVTTLTREETAMAYSQSWLFTHWVLTNPERFAKLAAYFEDTSAGMPVADALQANFQMTPDQLSRTLRTYLNLGIRHAEVMVPGTVPEVVITRLPDSADDVFPLYVNLRDGAPPAEGAVLLTRARALAARRPDEALTRLTLARAEILFGDPVAGETALAPALEADPADVEALLLMADARINVGEKLTDPAERERFYRQARGFLQRAFTADPNEYRVYQTIAYSRRNSSDYPTENDVELWRRAVALAPQVVSNRPVTAEAMLRRGLYDEAEGVIRPVANDPHGSEAPERIQRILDRIVAQRAAAAQNAAVATP